MAQVCVYVPDSLHAKMLEELPPAFNWSAAFQEAIASALGRIGACEHRVIRCADCGALAPLEDLAGVGVRGNGARGHP
jgi:uncharacterized protein CbrC (UPF0167 family)